MSLTKHLSLEERTEIEKLLDEQKTYSEIGLKLGRSGDCIREEVVRNGGVRNYSSIAAQNRYDLIQSRPRGLAPDKRTQAYNLMKSAVEDLKIQVELLTKTIKEKL
jgi:IS30 family transposase